MHFLSFGRPARVPPAPGHPPPPHHWPRPQGPPVWAFQCQQQHPVRRWPAWWLTVHPNSPSTDRSCFHTGSSATTQFVVFIPGSTDRFFGPLCRKPVFGEKCLMNLDQAWGCLNADLTREKTYKQVFLVTVPFLSRLSSLRPRPPQTPG